MCCIAGLLPGDGLVQQIVRLGVSIGIALAVLAGAAQLLQHSRVRRSARSHCRAREKDDRVTHRGWFGLHTSIWKIASTHVIVDAYTNIYAPLLPLLIPHLNLSLKTAGIIAMCFQMANSVSQLAFGTLADRWRPRALVVMGPLLAVIVLSFIGWAARR